MNSQEKREVVKNIKELIDSSNCILICNYKGMKVSDFHNLRDGARQFDSSVRVAKNTLVKKSLENTKFDNIRDVFKDQVLFIASKDEVSLAKFVAEFEKQIENLSLIAGSFFGEVYQPKDVEALSKTPSLDESRARILSLLNSSASKLVAVLNAPTRNIVGVLKSYSEK